jgi:hypothetical protein
MDHPYKSGRWEWLWFVAGILFTAFLAAVLATALDASPRPESPVSPSTVEVTR